MLVKLKAGTTLEQVASDEKLTVQKAIDLQRGKAGPNVPASVVDVAFKTPKDGFAASDGSNETQRYLLRVAQVTDPAMDTNAVTLRELKTLLQNAYSDDLVGQYLARLESEYNVSINQSAVNQVVGTPTER